MVITKLGKDKNSQPLVNFYENGLGETRNIIDSGHLSCKIQASMFKSQIGAFPVDSLQTNINLPEIGLSNLLNTGGGRIDIYAFVDKFDPVKGVSLIYENQILKAHKLNEIQDKKTVNLKKTEMTTFFKANFNTKPEQIISKSFYSPFPSFNKNQQKQTEIENVFPAVSKQNSKKTNINCIENTQFHSLLVDKISPKVFSKIKKSFKNQEEIVMNPIDKLNIDLLLRKSNLESKISRKKSVILPHKNKKRLLTLG